MAANLSLDHVSLLVEEVVRQRRLQQALLDTVQFTFQPGMPIRWQRGYRHGEPCIQGGDVVATSGRNVLVRNALTDRQYQIDFHDIIAPDGRPISDWVRRLYLAEAQP